MPPLLWRSAKATQGSDAPAGVSSEVAAGPGSGALPDWIAVAIITAMLPAVIAAVAMAERIRIMLVIVIFILCVSGGRNRLRAEQLHETCQEP